MGQKVNPHGLRVGVIKDWDSRWYAREDKVGELLVEDYNIRKFLKSTLYSAGIAKIEIERDNAKVKINLHVSRPGVVIGKGGTEIEKLRQKVADMIGKNVALNIIEIRSPDLNAQLVAENIAAQLEKRISFRRAMKQAMQRATRLGAKGIKCTCGGRLGGAEIARSESYHEGTIPLQTLRADIEYGFAEANTTYGKVGCKTRARSSIPPCAPPPWSSPPAASAATAATAVPTASVVKAAASTATVARSTATVPTTASADPLTVRKEATANADAQENQVPQSSARPHEGRCLPRQQGQLR